MINKWILFVALPFFGLVSANVASSSRSILPPVTPDFCAKNFCFHARGPYAARSIVSQYGRRRESGAVVFADNTVISFAAVSTNDECTDFKKNWVRKGNVSSLTYLCIPQQREGNLLVAIQIRSKVASTVERYEGESEICVWSFSTNKAERDGDAFLWIRNEACVGDRMGYALPG
jgi:hypothetical protein